MAASGYSPISLYYSTTASATPTNTNLVNGELALNITDGKLFYKDNAGVVQTLATKAATSGTYTNITVTGGSINGTTIGATTASTGAFTTLSASSTVSGTGFSTYLASPPAIGGTTPSTGNFTTLTGTAISGSFNGSVGATTPNTGAFTTTTISTSETLSYGTANGVAYLNGSKVVTTGTALTFDGTNLLIGSPAFPSSGRIQLKQANDSTKQKGLLIEASGDDSILAIGYDGSAFTFNPTYNTTGAYKPMAWWVSGSEQMRLTSTGLGIGTSSPGAKLAVTGSSGGGYSGLFTQTATSLSNGCYTLTVDSSSHTSNLSAAGAFNVLVNSGTGLVVNGLGNLGIGTSSPNIGGVNKAITLNSATNTNCSYELAVNGVQLGALYTTISTNALNLLGIANGPLTFGTNGSERMRLDSSGNLGLGVTPSAWTAGGKNIEVGSAGNIIQGQASQIAVIQNATYNSGWKYSANGYASFALQTTGQHQWFTAPSGTAGNTITFTQAMTLDASGRLGIANTSPGVDLEIGSNTSTTRVLSVRYSSVPLYLSGGFDGTYALSTFSTNSYANATGSGQSWSSFSNSGYSASAIQLASASGSEIRFLTAAAANTNPTERARIDSSGNLGVGRTNPGVRLSVAGNSDSWQLALSTNSGSTGAVIGSPAADVLAFGSWAGTERARIDSSGRLLLGTTSATIGAVTCAVALDATTVNSGFGMGINGNASNTQVMRFAYAGTAVGSIAITTSTTAYNTTSDYRLKDNQQPLTGSGEFIDALQPKTWDWKADGSKGVGFIAHEVQEVSPNSVVGEKDGEQMQAMEYGSAEFIANIIAELQSLRKRVAQLEAK